MNTFAIIEAKPQERVKPCPPRLADFPYGVTRVRQCVLGGDLAARQWSDVLRVEDFGFVGGTRDGKFG